MVIRPLWTVHALAELEETVRYLSENFSEREIHRLAVSIERTLRMISTNPLMYPVIDGQPKVHRAVVAEFNDLYYRVNGDNFEILSFFSNRQDLSRRPF